ncbi:MAG: ABC transporter permease [Pseudomonadota bacterium]
MDGTTPHISEAQRPAVSRFGERRFGAVNWLGMRTLYMREIRRFMKVATQTIFAPVVSAILFLLVFDQAFADSRPAINGVPFLEFLAPGLIMMAVATNAFSNSSSSLIGSKMQGSIVDVLMPPMAASELTIAYVAGAATRGLLVGIVTAATAALYMAFTDTPMSVASIGAIAYFSIIAAIMFGALGVVGGIWAEKFDHLAAITNFFITPLTFLSGTFYAVTRLPEPFRTVSEWNPMYFLVDGLRSGFTGVAESNLLLGGIVTLALAAAFCFWAFALFRSGYNLKA